MAYLTLPPEFIPEAKTVINWFMSATPLVTYGTTLLSIRRKKSSKGFSIDICATMLIASTFRIFYYINEPFEISLLRQCFVMIFIHVLLLKVAIKYRDPTETAYLRYEESWPEFLRSAWNVAWDPTDEGSVYGDPLEKASNAAVQYARRWDEYSQYMQFFGGLVLSLTTVQLVFGRTEWLGLVFASCSFLIESTLPLPQILLFQRLRTVENFKTILLLSWLGGDLTKISYLMYGTDNVGVIFVVAAIFQMSLNLVITYQFFYYKHMDTVSSRQVIPLSHTKEEIPMDEFRVSGTFSASSSRGPFSPVSSSQFPSPATTPILNPKLDHTRSRASTFNEHEAQINKSLRKVSLSSSVNLETMKEQSSKLNH
ncbi:hypothetical protein KL929_004270 [Ogataea haglerorum]|nr:hypothetical protein KL951_004799 [Ogataea haglerorum]KAG7764732.1 hypothetical protein KL931_004659 [Ogataea haglerorum]KAG7795139.1 hypothetical protein KL929_004270 [Ogataea haglerorum]KAG7798370.1 hypothetical protein KL944_004512 [Ogataea haglerorum]